MYKHVFGPVPSRRLGISLGVDLVLSKSCNLNCIFCECGATKKIQLERQRFKDMNEILNEIQSVLKDIKPCVIGKKSSSLCEISFPVRVLFPVSMSNSTSLRMIAWLAVWS